LDEVARRPGAQVCRSGRIKSAFAEQFLSSRAPASRDTRLFAARADCCADRSICRKGILAVAVHTFGSFESVAALKKAQLTEAQRVALESTAPANRRDHFAHFRFFTIDDGIGTERRTFHGVSGA
jgi:hypothetical protein